MMTQNLLDSYQLDDRLNQNQNPLSPRDLFQNYTDYN